MTATAPRATPPSKSADGHGGRAHGGHGHGSHGHGTPDLDLKGRADVALGNDQLRRAVRLTVDRLRGAKAESTATVDDWEALREKGRALRAHVIDNLDGYLDEFITNLEARGGRVHRAADAADAANIVLQIAREREARSVVKSKSMVSEETGINEHLEAHGVKAIETDLGEWIIQLAKETPSHIILPAIHKNRGQIRSLFEDEGGQELSEETKVLAGHARQRLRAMFAAADMGMSGCNFAIAETGSIALFSNEGNARMVTTLPKTHVVLMGMERIIPKLTDLELMTNLLARSATGQKITTYLSVLSGPRRPGELDGPDQLHVVVVDNGRSRIRQQPEFREALQCIRCGACLNVCPVYRQIGGHAYGSIYPGPIGAVITPLLRDDRASSELAEASSLCGACYEACPVKIPLHDMLVRLRRRSVERHEKKASERLAFRITALVLSSLWLYTGSGKIGRWFLRRLARINWLARRLPVLRGWQTHRRLPVIPAQSFRDAWAKGISDGNYPAAKAAREGVYHQQPLTPDP